MRYAKIALIVILAFYFGTTALHPADGSFLDTVDLIFHEAGHTIFIFMPQFFYVLAGSAFQIFIPLMCTAYFLQKYELYSASIVMFWLGQSIINVSVYAGDAVALQLPLLGGDGVIHDWNYLLTELGLLNYTPLIAHLIFGAGVVVLISAVLLGISSASYKKIPY